ncbi:uncharacterized protein LOC62_01G000934 [Vanrija pseudolonga]|uniref:Uncharacterized protein n=1 Tax=Vanrija pseudolonga TaxID=143232 RepID=A0AAF0Y392_9TREE|nr:hypothetical protein LOC62_01G000934 [Vanrija pseudolonga]
MASMDDLIATINGGMHVGQQSGDLKELHAKLTQTLHQPSLNHYRPIPPATSQGPHDSEPVPPPAPVSSWNEPAQPAAHLLSSAGSAWSTGLGNSPRQTLGGGPLVSPANGSSVAFVGRRETGFSAPVKNEQPKAPSSIHRPHHNTVLPSNASPVDTGGFSHDAFRPLWESNEPKSHWQGFTNSR